MLLTDRILVDKQKAELFINCANKLHMATVKLEPDKDNTLADKYEMFEVSAHNCASFYMLGAMFSGEILNYKQ